MASLFAKLSSMLTDGQNDTVPKSNKLNETSCINYGLSAETPSRFLKQTVAHVPNYPLPIWGV